MSDGTGGDTGGGMSGRVHTRIICVGNRLLDSDDAGLRVHDRLARAALPPGVELIDGGLRGLDLLPLLGDCRRVVFVDAVAGFAAPGTVVVIPAATLAEEAGETAYGHTGGLGYLLAVLPAVSDGPPPEITIVGLEQPATNAAVAEAARLCLSLLSGASLLSGDACRPSNDTCGNGGRDAHAAR